MEGMPVFHRPQFQDNLRAWSKSFDELLVPKKTRLEDAGKAGIAINRKGQEQYKALKERAEILEQEWRDKAKVVGQKLDQMAVYETEAAHVRQDLDQSKEWIIRLTEWRDQRKKFIAEDLQALQELAEAAKKNAVKTKKSHAVRNGPSYAGSIFGIKFIFSNIDPSEVDREFSITLYHDERADKYSMLDCQPPLKAAQGLVDILNQRNEFFKFVRRIRQEFQALVLCWE